MQWQYSIVLQNVSIGGNLEQCTRDLSVLFLTIACDSTMISVILIINKIEPGLLLSHLISAVSPQSGIDLCSKSSFFHNPLGKRSWLWISHSPLYTEIVVLRWLSFLGENFSHRKPRNLRHGVSWRLGGTKPPVIPRPQSAAAINHKQKQDFKGTPLHSVPSPPLKILGCCSHGTIDSLL